MEFILNLAIKSLEQVWLSLLHNWPYLAVSAVIARWRVIVLVVGILWIGAILCGYAFNLVLTLGLF